jgi:hypothetical protein
MLVGAGTAALAMLTDLADDAFMPEDADRSDPAEPQTPPRVSAHEGVQEAHVPGAPVDQPDQRTGEPPRRSDVLPDAERMSGLEPHIAAAPDEAPGPSVPAPTSLPASDIERAELVDRLAADPYVLGIERADPVDQLAAQEEAAAAAEAAGIGGPAPNDAVGLDPAFGPVYEAGGGPGEGFEQSTNLLEENASHGSGDGNPLRDAFDPEAESDLSPVEYGESDQWPSDSAESALDDPDDDAGAGPRRGAL